jgi:hypothetical protein
MILEEQEQDGIIKKNYNMILGFSFTIERGLLFGWEYFPATEENKEELNIYLVFICIHINWNNEEEI